ncbi:MAG TPA: hypothetical protein VF574_00850 [Allosphingosinicella sp.]|jgi:hypothetical protein
MHAWKQLRGEIASATRLNFERLALSLLRLMWPDLFRPPEGDQLDVAGVDLAAGLEGTHLECAVQCKGFYAAEQLTRSNYRQIKKSVETYLASPFSCDDYVLFHNRDSRDRALTAAIEADLERIVQAGKAARAKVWDRQTFIRDYSKEVRRHLIERLTRHSDRTLERMSRIFDFGDIYVPAVPVSEQRLTLVRGERPKIEGATPVALREPAKLISHPSKTRWTLLMGLFGTGKSSAALRAAQHSNRLLIYTRCADMSARDGGVGTNSLMESVIGSLALFEDFDEESRARLVRLSGTLLRQALVGEENSALLILDGLDENRDYATPRGVMTLSSALAELRCPILFTTREEHFNATFGNYENLLEDHSTKGGARREARLLRLEPWTDEQVAQFLDRAAERSDQQNIRRLKNRLEAGDVAERELQLLRHPLFLQMIASLAASGEETGTSAADVLGKWTYLKMSRDLQSDRVLPGNVYNALDYATAMGEALQEVAGAMIEHRSGSTVLTETVSEEFATAVLAKAFPGHVQNVVTATSASLLIPSGPKLGARSQLMFSHRIFQEYYLARHLVATGADCHDFPPEVVDLCRQMQDS